METVNSLQSCISGEHSIQPLLDFRFRSKMLGRITREVSSHLLGYKLAIQRHYQSGGRSKVDVNGQLLQRTSNSKLSLRLTSRPLASDSLAIRHLLYSEGMQYGASPDHPVPRRIEQISAWHLPFALDLRLRERQRLTWKRQTW